MDSAALDAHVARWVAKGWRVESRSATQAVLVKGSRYRRNRMGFWGGLAVICTAGLWLLVMALVNSAGMAASGEQRLVLTLTPEGVVETKGRRQRR